MSDKRCDMDSIVKSDFSFELAFYLLSIRFTGANIK